MKYTQIERQGSTMNDVIALEFNELNAEVLQRMMSAGKLPNFSRLLQHNPMLTTRAEESYVNLEPWIQWVTVHTGKTQREHGAFNLSDVQHSDMQQAWDLMAQQGIRCGVVSPMNARRGDFESGFFIPDPWSTSNDTFPQRLHPVYQFLQQRVQSHNISLEAGASRMSFAMELLRLGMPLRHVADVAMAYVASRLDPKKKWRLAAELDRFLWRLTKILRNKFKTEFTSVFMNSVAHYQHHYWTDHDAKHWAPRYPALFARTNPMSEANLHPGDDPIAYGLQVYDDIVGEALDEVGPEGLIVITGLSQVPFDGKLDKGAPAQGFYLYRPFDHEAMLKALNIQHARVAPLMSRDMMLYFDTEAQRQQALDDLKSVTVNGLAVFSCTQETDLRLFCKVFFSDAAADDAVIQMGGRTVPGVSFGQLFKLITFKTGHHHCDGLVIAPQRALDGASRGDVVPLVKITDMLFKMVGLRDACHLASDLRRAA